MISGICTALNAYAADMEICGELKQGEMVMLQNIRPDIKELTLNNRVYPITEDRQALIAFHRDEKSKVKMSATLNDGAKLNYDLDIKPAKWDIQHVKGVAQHKVTPDKSHENEIWREQTEVGRALRFMQAGDYWREGFMMPVAGRISGEFGNQRIFNGTPKSPHTGTDIAAPEETPVQTSSSGVVILSGNDYFYSGNTLIIDHGQGLQTVYAHLKEFYVRQGDEVKKGDVIGVVGKTGRATGPHLHWGASLNNVRFRPQSLLETKGENCLKLEAK